MRPKAWRAAPGRFPRSPSTGRPGRRPLPRGGSSRATATPHAASPARSRNGHARRLLKRDQDRAPQQPIAASFGLLPGLGASNTGLSPPPFCLATALDPLTAGRYSIVGGCSRPAPYSGTRRSVAGRCLRGAVAAAEASRGDLTRRLLDHSKARLRSLFECGRWEAVPCSGDWHAWRSAYLMGRHG